LEADTIFDSASGANSAVRTLVLDGTDLYLGGQFTTYKGTTRERVCKVNSSTAALDTTFDSASGASSTVYALALDGTGLYLGGQFTTYKGTTRERICKVNSSTAALDTTFDSASGAGSIVQALALDGSDLYLGGSFTTYKAWARARITRVDTSTADDEWL